MSGELTMGNLFHYTKKELLPSIVQQDGLHFWASRYDCMNDSEEYKWLYEPLRLRISDEKHMTEKEVNELYEKFPYVISFSEKENSPELWNRYGNNGGGICLVLDREKLISESEQNISDGEWDVAMPVKYADEDTKMQTLGTVVEEYRRHGYGTANQGEQFDDGIYCSAFVKNKATWEVESEFRYARIRERGMQGRYTDQGGELYFPEDKRRVKYYNRDGKRIPYLEIVFPLSILVGIINGNGSHVKPIYNTL